MGSKFRNLKDQLKNLEESDSFASGSLSRKRSSIKSSGSSVGWFRYSLFAAFLISFLLYAGARYTDAPSISLNPFDALVTWVNQPDEELLERMGAQMEEMGYTGLTTEELIELREQGVTATYTSGMRDLGYTDLSLNDVVRLSQNGVSTTFTAMMAELGYSLTVEDLIQLEQHDVTAFFTSNLHDLGYTDVTTDELIRLRDTGVTISEVEQLISESETQPSIEELIRYHISNQ